MYRSNVVCALFLAVFVSGCNSGDAIRSYTVPKSTEQTKSTEPLSGDARLLGVMIPTGEAEYKWFIKFVGPIEAVNAAEQDFEQFLAEMRITGTGPARKLEWNAPAAWKIVPPESLSAMTRSLRLGTYSVGSRERTIELSISTPISGSTLENVDRWRKVDVNDGDQPLTDASLAKYAREKTVAGAKAVYVDMRGKAVPKDAKRGPMMGGK